MKRTINGVKSLDGLNGSSSKDEEGINQRFSSETRVHYDDSDADSSLGIELLALLFV